MRMITLTYYQLPDAEGHGAKATNKEFDQNVDMINRITEYNNSTKLETVYGDMVEVVESKHQILGRIMSAGEL